ncbi:hypothetical protein D3C72_744390 [compost metagenome]
MTSSRTVSGSTARSEKNSSIPTGLAPHRIGKAKQLFRPTSAAAAERGRPAAGKSRIQVGAPVANTPPGMPWPLEKVRALVTTQKGAKRSGDWQCQWLECSSSGVSGRTR